MCKVFQDEDLLTFWVLRIKYHPPVTIYFFWWSFSVWNCTRRGICSASIMKVTNKMQLYRLIYISLSALHVSGDVFAHHQGHLTVFTVSGSVHPGCCRLVSWMSWVELIAWKEQTGMCMRFCSLEYVIYECRRKFECWYKLSNWKLKSCGIWRHTDW
jgi:hypothetical protein